MKQLLYAALLVIAACNFPKNKEQKENTDPQIELAGSEAKNFIIEFTSRQPQPVYVVTTLRDRYLTKRDEGEVNLYFEKDTLGHAGEFSFSRTAEQLLDTSGMHNGIIWVDDHDIYTCRTVLRDLWPCFKNKYGGSGFYYFSIPQFSNDGQYALVSINFSGADPDKSRGGTRLFKKEKGRWEEIAIMTNWGAEPDGIEK